MFFTDSILPFADQEHRLPTRDPYFRIWCFQLETWLVISHITIFHILKVNFAFHCEIKVPTSGGKSGGAQGPTFSGCTVGDGLGAMWSAGVGAALSSQKVSVASIKHKSIFEHFTRSDQLYGDADFFQDALQKLV